MLIHIELVTVLSDSCRLRRREAKCTDVKNFILIEAFSQHKAVLSEQTRVEIVHWLKEDNTS